MHDRATVLDGLRDRPQISVLILGGGVNGCGLFRELALQGVDCLLVDKADFVAGASSKSSRMIHGGLRYLETREVALVRESLAERNRLIDNAAHYVSPLKTTIPLFSWLGGMVRSTLLFMGFHLPVGDRGALITKIGLSFYDFVTRKNRRTPRHFLTSKAKSLARIPGLNRDIIATATYWDAQISQAERLCIELLADGRAANPDCRALNYVRPEAAEGGRVLLRDEVSGERVAVEPRIVANATGAWVDRANAALGLDTQFMGGTKGSHLVVDCPDLHEALGGQMVYYQHSDGRVCIVFPFGDKLLMGSTDLRIDDPDAASCDDDEIEYMLTTLRGVFPGIEVRRDQIVYVFSGVRPLPASEQGVTATITRGHFIRAIEPEGGRPFPVLCLIGGKWTTFRALAEQAADQLLDRLSLERRCSTEHIAIGGGKNCPSANERQQWIERGAGETGLSAERVATLFGRYGTAAAQFGSGDETPLKTLPDYSVGEIRRIAETEQVVHLDDLICRRSTIAILGRAAEPALAELARTVGAALDWDAARQADEVSRALAEVTVPGPP